MSAVYGVSWRSNMSPIQSVGGADQVDPARFGRFSLTLLGHLHRPQQVAGAAFYAGSPLKYSFSEADHHKSVALYDLAADGTFTRELVPLTPRRDLRLLSGSLDELLARADADPARGDYLSIDITDHGRGLLRQHFALHFRVVAGS